MRLELYYMDESPPCRAVMMLIRHLNLEVDLKYVNLATGEHLTDQHLRQTNPQCLVPTLNDNGFGLGESRAIMRYLVSKYAPQSHLYPTGDLQLRAKIDELLDFDLGSLYSRQSRLFEPLLVGQQTLDEANMKKFLSALSHLENHRLESSDFLTGSEISIGDLSVLASLTYAEAAQFDMSPFPKLGAYLARCKKQLPYYSAVNEKAVGRFAHYISSLRKS